MIFETETLTGVAERFGPGAEPSPDGAAELLSLLHDHSKRESLALSGYEQLVENGDGDGIRYLANMIVEDERRHHRLIAEMLNRVRYQTDGVDLEPSVPGGVHVDRDAFEQTRRFLDIERDDERELRRLRRTLRHEPAGSLLPLLVDLILHDTAKHIEILEFIAAQHNR